MAAESNPTPASQKSREEFLAEIDALMEREKDVLDALDE
jgi:hypothetical protein